ncbi:MAG: flagellin, partial [Planctomycetota bacterium]
LLFVSDEYGSKQFVTVEAIAGSFAASGTKDVGQDATVTINGTIAEADGLEAKARSGNLDIEVTVAEVAGITPGTTTQFDITGGGTRFQIGSQVQNQSQVAVGIGSMSTSRLGNNTVGFLSEIGSGGNFSLVGGNSTQAQRVLNEAISEVATLRGRLGALQRNVLETNINSLQVAMENTTAAESVIRDADFAAETAELTRAQILAQANTSVLSQANAQPQQVLALLQG